MANKSKEYKSGFVSGLRHGNPIKGTNSETTKALYAENEEKMKKGINSPEINIRHYWQGYEEGMNLHY